MPGVVPKLVPNGGVIQEFMGDISSIKFRYSVKTLSRKNMRNITSVIITVVFRNEGDKVDVPTEISTVKGKYTPQRRVNGLTQAHRREHGHKFTACVTHNQYDGTNNPGQPCGDGKPYFQHLLQKIYNILQYF